MLHISKKSLVYHIYKRNIKLYDSFWKKPRWRSMGGAKDWRALEHFTSKTQTCRFTYRLQFWIMTGIFYSWDCSMFQYQTMRKSTVELSLVYKTFINKHTWETPLLPWKNKLNCLRNAGFFGKLNKVIFPSQTKTYFFRDILPVQQCSRMKCVDGRALAPVDACTGALFREKCP